MFYKKFLLLLLLSTIPIAVHSQREAANWYFGNSAGLDFNSGEPIVQNDGALITEEGCATISNENGNLLFYTDGMTVYDRNHEVMPNGTGLKGDRSSTQSAIIVPRPGSTARYYIFTIDKPNYYRTEDNPIEGVNYSEVDMSLNGGFGEVVSDRKNIHLLTYNPEDPLENEYKSSEKISAVSHASNTSLWVVSQLSDKFYAFLVTQDGVQNSPTISTTPNNVPPIIDDIGVNISALGYLKFSPDGKKLAIAFSSTALGDSETGTKNTGKVFLYDFDDSTGEVDNEQVLLTNSYPYGVEFSPTSTKLYITANIFNESDVLLQSDLYQFNLESNNIANSRQTIHSSNNVAGALQLAIDGKIYRAGYPIFTQNHKMLSVISNPEASGNTVGHRHNFLDLEMGSTFLGLPPFIQSLFLTDFDFENFCLGDETRFFITSDEPFDTVLWEFGDGNTSTDEEAFHTYEEPGTYPVTLIKYINGEIASSTSEEVIITAPPEVLPEFVLSQCDTQDSDPNDEIATFNLQLASNPIALGNENVNVYFYEDYETAVNDVLNENTLDTIFTNTSQNQLIYAKVVAPNSFCFSMANVRLQVNQNMTLEANPAIGCGLGDGTAEFNFEDIESNIISELNLPDDVELTFHETENEASLGQNPLPNNYISEEKTIFIRGQSENSCYGLGSLELQIKAFSSLQSLQELGVCSSNFPISLSSNIQDGNYSYEWSTGETTPEIEVFEAGTYTLQITDNEIGCGRTTEFLITESTSPEIDDIEITVNGETSDITVSASSNEDVLYALDNIDGPYQENPFFGDVAPGRHIIYVKNNNNCEIKQREILVFGFPSFFTPNNDGYNDTWQPFTIKEPEFEIENIYIFDRYGKLLKELNPNGSGWDGTFNNKNMPEDDYWFRVNLVNGEEFRGHFSLLR